MIVQDPRITPIARTCDLFLPVKPGRDAALFAGVLQPDDRERLDRSRVHRRAHRRLRAGRRILQQWTPRQTAEVTGVAAAGDRCRPPRWWGTAKTSFLFHARGIEHHSNGVQNALGTINLVLASGRIGKPKSGYGTIVGQANGQGGREHGQKCDQLPGLARHQQSRAPRVHRRRLGHGREGDARPRRGRLRDVPQDRRGEIKGLLSICFNPKVSLPDNHFITRCLDKLEFYVAIDFFLNDTACHADIVLPGSLQEEDEGTVTQVEGRVIKINKAVDCPGDAREDWRIIQDIAQALGRPHGFTFNDPREIFEELRVASKGGVADYSGITYEKIERQIGVFWPCYSDDPRPAPRSMTIPARRGSSSRQLQPGRQGRRAVLFPRRQGPFQRRRLSPAGGRRRAKSTRSILTTGRVVSQFLSGTQTRRIGPLVDQYPEPRIEMHPRLAEKLGIADGDGRRPRPGAGRSR